MILDFMGSKTQITAVPVGDCFLVLDALEPQIAIMVANNAGHRFALVLPAPIQGQQPAAPALISETRVALEAIHLPNARIVPSKALKDCKFGYYANGLPSMALYLDGQKSYLRSNLGDMAALTFEVTSGTQASVDFAYHIYSKSWGIGDLKSNGTYDMIVQFELP